MSFIESVKRSYEGAKELRQYALEKYEGLPFIVELHDTPLYRTFFENYPPVKYGLFYPKLNRKLGKILEEFSKYSKNSQIVIVSDEMRRSPAYHSTTIEFWPIHFNTKLAKFYTMNVKEAENFSRSVITYLQKKN